jgi:hypothetical protein
MTTGDVDHARAILGWHFYANVVDVLSPVHRWQAQFEVTPDDSVVLGDLRFGRDVRIRFGELGAYHVDIPISGELAWRQGSDAPRLATPARAAVFQPVGDTTLERWNADCRLLAVKIDRAALENRLARMLDGPVTSPVRLDPQLDLAHGPGATWFNLVKLLVADAEREPGLVRHPFIARSFRDSLISGLLLADARCPPDGPPGRGGDA